MKYLFETIVSPTGCSFNAEVFVGDVVDSVLHVHPELELTYVESSFGVRFIGDNISEFRANDLVLIGSMLPHHYVSSQQDSLGPDWWRAKVLQFRRDFAGCELFGTAEFDDVSRMLREADHGLVFDGAVAAKVKPVLDGLFDETSPMRVVRLLELLVRLAETDYVKLSTNLARSSAYVPDDRMNRALDFIHSSLDEGAELSLARVAEVVCMTPQAFSRYFRRSTQKRFIDYIVESKIGRACGLLGTSDLAIIDVAAAAGFGNLSNFNRHFARLKQMSPREYRNRIRGKG